MQYRGLVPLLFAGAALGDLIIDNFASRDGNTLGNYHGCDEVGESSGPPPITCTWGTNSLTIQAADTDYSFYTQFNGGCQDISFYDRQYLHIKYSGSAQFSIALQQNNPGCNFDAAPFPETWDIVNAADYSKGTDIYVPMSHFSIIKSRAIGLAFKAFRDPSTATTFSLVEIVSSLPSGVSVPQKKETGPLYFACTRPNSIAFGIDDGNPIYMQDIMKIIDAAGIKVTFFTVGNSLEDSSLNFTNFYREAAAKGHQIGFHSYTHPKIEGLNDIARIDEEFSKSHQATLNAIGVDSKYFRAPYGTDGALTRQRLQAVVPGAKVINWSVDIQDWIYGPTADTGKEQTKSVERDLAKGGNLFVAHYLYESTVQQFADFIDRAKGTGKQIMRIDQCLDDPNAPPL